MSFNYFGVSASHASRYAKFRPTPPKCLIEAIIDVLNEKGGKKTRAVDVGCGSGQSTNILADHFENVVGVDPSEEIIKEANSRNRLPNVEFMVSGAEELPFEHKTVDLLTTVQAIHWFDLPKFYTEANRVLKDNGVLAVYGYNLPEPTESVESAQLIKKYYNEVLKDYVLDGSRQVYLNNYREPQFNKVPFVENGTMNRKEGFTCEISANLSDITGYISTWSGFQQFVKIRGDSEAQALLSRFQEELTATMGKKPHELVKIRYRYFLLTGRKGAKVTIN